MKNKPHDIEYAGCRKDKILSARPVINENNFRMFVYYIKERSKIHIKKDLMGENSPWTRDHILRSVRFTNVKREQDKETAYLINKVCKSNASYEMKIASIILFRMLNKKESCDGLLPCNFYNTEYLVNAIRWIRGIPTEHKPFNRAFMVSGMMGNINAVIGKRDSQIQSCYDYTMYLWGQEIPRLLSKMTKAQDMYDTLNSIPGFGSFLAYQMWVDMTYCPECPVSENEFVVAGPGCKEGIKLLFYKRDGMTPEECLFWLRDNWDALLNHIQISWDADELFPDLPAEERNMNVMSLENCCCEISKYHRAWTGGFVKQKYNGG